MSSEHHDPTSCDQIWGYPEEFDSALEDLFGQSFAECDLKRELRDEVMADWRASRSVWGRLEVPRRIPLHTALMWTAGRLDLTAESLLLSEAWRSKFPASWLNAAEARIAALGWAAEQQKSLTAGSSASRIPDERLAGAGYRTRIVSGRVFVVFEPRDGSAIGAEFFGNVFGAWIDGMCDDVVQSEEALARAPVFSYDRARHRHQILCERCRTFAPQTAALNAAVADEQFRRMRSYLVNLAECLDFGDLKLNRVVAATGQDGHPPDEVRHALLWRAFLLVNYLPHVADLFVYCVQPEGLGKPINPWTSLRNGAGETTAMEFVRSLTRREFETALLSYEILSAVPDYPDFLAFREMPYPMPALQIPDAGESLAPIPGFLEVEEGATGKQWSDFIEHTIAEQMPWWGFDAIGGLIKLAAKAAGSTIAESGLDLTGAPASEKLEAIGSQVSAVYGAQLPMMDLQEGTLRAVGEVAQQQAEQSDLLRQIREQLSRPTKSTAENSLRKILGEAIYHGMTDEARAAAIEGELRFLQRDTSDHSVVAFQLAKAFECQLRAVVLEPLRQRRRTQSEYRYELRDVERMLEQSDADLLRVLCDSGLDHRLLHQKVRKVVAERNLAAHQAVMSEQRVATLRRDWLGNGKPENSIFAAVVQQRPEGTTKDAPNTGARQGKSA